MRVAAQAAAGVGFIGGGAILKEARRSAVWSCTTSLGHEPRAAPGPPIARGARRPRPAHEVEPKGAHRPRRRLRPRTAAALSAGISRRDRPARLRPSSRGAAHRVRPGRCCSARARAGSSPARARPPGAPVLRRLRAHCAGLGTSRSSRTAWATVTSPRCASTLTSSTPRGAAPSVAPAWPPGTATGWQRGWQRPAAPKRTSPHRRHRPKWSIARQSAPADTGAHRPRLTPLLSGRAVETSWDDACSVHVGRTEQAMKDVTVTLENRPGRLADFGEATGRAGINIEGSAAPPRAARASSTSWWRTRPPRAPP
jgi:hypothetical protein